MPSAFLDVCRFTPTLGGTTNWTYSAAVTGYQSPAAAGAINGTQYSYRAESADLSQWEIGYGTYNTSTNVLTRGTVLFNSLGTTAKVSFSTVPTVAIVALGEDIVSRMLDVKVFGAIGDGVTDDTAAVQRALNTGGHVYLSVGTYAISSPLSFTVPGQKMFGAGLGVSTLLATSGFSGSAYPQQNSLLYFGQFQPGPQIADIRLTCAVPGSVAIGVNAINSPRFRINNCRITMFQVCLNMTGNSGGADISGLEIWSGCNSSNSGYAIQIEGSVDCVNFDRLRVWPFDDPSGGTITASITSNVLTVTSAVGNFLAVGQTITGTGVSCTITSFGSGIGGNGTYNITANSNVASRTMTAVGISFVSQTGIYSGRMDGLFITNSMFICLNQLNLVAGIGPVATFTGTTNGTTSLIVTGITSGQVQIGATLLISGVAQAVTVASQSSGPTGGNGTYVLSGTQGTASTTMQVGYPGPTFCNISNTDFDSFNGIIVSAGYLGVSNCIHTNGGGALFGSTATNLITITGGRVEITGCYFFNIGTCVGVAITGGRVTITGCNFDMAGNTSCAVGATGGEVVCNGNTFARTSGIGGSYLISYSSTCRGTAIGNRGPIDGTGNFLQTTVDTWHTIVYNQTGGWTNSFAGTTTTQTVSPNK